MCMESVAKIVQNVSPCKYIFLKNKKVVSLQSEISRSSMLGERQ